MQVPITASVTAHRRTDQTIATLKALGACDPRPAEILVHVDDNQIQCATSIRIACPSVRVMVSEANVGPGGGRNRLIEAATHPIVASFDDDSYPVDGDYFARVATVLAMCPEAAVLCAHVYHSDERIEPASTTAEWVADFSGGACAYRRDRLVETGGYVPLPVAYGMEEVDLALRLHANGQRVLRTPWLRVFHDTDRRRHADATVTAASIANLALLAYLRYPVSLWPIGLAQCLNRVRWLIRNGRREGIGRGLLSIPAQLLKYRRFRRRLPAKAVRSYLRLRRCSTPVRLDFDHCEPDMVTSATASE